MADERPFPNIYVDQLISTRKRDGADTGVMALGKG